MPNRRMREPPKRSPELEDIRTAVELFETEMRFVEYNVQGSVALQMHVTIARRAMLLKLVDCFGGAIYELKKQNVLRWRLTGEPLQSFLRTLEPELSQRGRSRLNAFSDYVRTDSAAKLDARKQADEETLKRLELRRALSSSDPESDQ